MRKGIFTTLAFAFLLMSKVDAQDSQGFFLKSWEPKKAVIPESQDFKFQILQLHNGIITVDEKKVIGKVSKYLFGNNTNPYMTQIVTEPKLMSQLQVLSPNILRFPGGNISNLYFWDAAPFHKPADVPDTILYGDNRKPRREKMWYGKDENPNSLTLENYYKLLKQTGSTGTICVNAGYARYGTGANPIATAAHYAAQWVRYDKGRTHFWEVGNEDYGTWQAGYKIDTTKNQDGQPEITNGEWYGKIFKIFSDSMHAAAKEVGSEIYVGATIIEAPVNSRSNDEVKKNWNTKFFQSVHDAADFFVIHSYYTPYQKDSKPDEILNSATTVTDNMMQYMKAICITNKVQLKPIALTEWNIFAEGSKQQTSYINGMHAAIALGALASQKFGMACRWDLANGYANGNDHGLFNKGDEPGMPKWSARPAYYYMYYFQKYFGDNVVATTSDDKEVLVYASTFSDGKTGLVIINKDSIGKAMDIRFNAAKPKGKLYWYTLTGGADNSPFSQKVVINGVEPSLPAGGPDNFEKIKARSANFINGKVTISIQAKAVNYVLIDAN